WRFFYADLSQSGPVQALGGGMIGALLYTVTFFLFAHIGSYITAVLLFLAGVVFLFNVPVDKIAQKIKEASLSMWQTIQQKRKERQGTKKENTKSKKKKKLSEEKSGPEIISASADVSDYIQNQLEEDQPSQKSTS